jgi:hypothetical protein
VAEPDATSFGPVLGDDPLVPVLGAEPVATPPSVTGPGADPPSSAVQRATTPGVPLPGTPGHAARSVPLQRASAPGSWSPAHVADAAPVLVGLVGTRTPTGSAVAAPVAGAPVPPATDVPLQRSAAPDRTAPDGAAARGTATVVARTAIDAPGVTTRPGPASTPSTRPTAVPASIQRLLAAQAAQEMAQQASVQRDEETAPDAVARAAGSPAEPVVVQTAPTAVDAPASSAVTAVPGAPGPGAGGLTDVDALVGKLYDPLVRRLKAELRLERERAGHVLDLRQ